jgi:Domain of unknown function (DUF222)
MFGGSEIVAAMRHWERVIAQAQAQQFRTIVELARLRRHPNGSLSEYTADEIAVALNISGAAAGQRLALALDLDERLPATLDALESGRIDLLRARAVSEGTRPLAAEQAAEVERRVLTRAGEQTAPQVRQSVKRAVLRVDPEGAAARYQARRAERRIVYSPADDGMAELWAYLPAPAAAAIYETVQVTACRATTPDDQRTADQRRADAFIDLLFGESTTGPVAHVNVTVPVGTLLGVDDEPGELAGYGPIPAELSRELAADSTWRRLLTDPASGALLDYGRATYRPPAALADFVRARDRTCRFPGCRRPAHRCQLDHRTEYPEGATSAENLDALCTHHHQLKHHGTWASERLANGDYRWRSPAGFYYLAKAEPIVEPRARPPVVEIELPELAPF